MADHGLSLPRTLVSARKSKLASPERFTLLLLEFGEIYFEDFSALYLTFDPSDHLPIERKQRGRLKVCSHSILFDPLQFSYPVIKIAYRDCTAISLIHSPELNTDSHSLLIKATQVTEMLEGNTVGPYRFIKEESKHLFSLNYGSIESVYSQILTLQRATKLPRTDQQSLITSLVMGRRAAVSFNTSWLEDLYEERMMEVSGERVTPLVSNPGRIMLTSSRLYFQPYNNVEMEPVLKVKLLDLQYVYKRRYMLRHVGIELFYGSESMFLVLSSTKERNEMYQAIISIQPKAALREGTLSEFTHQWRTGVLSNYEYLMTLNFLADRSFNDIMQYPVMPWVIADYASSELNLSAASTFRDLSKPIGALNEERLEFFKKRYSEMSGKKFLYGTHYSAPGYVLYYMVRSAPEYLLCLQNGNFDRPNRLFHSIRTTWENVISDHADVKELIPEFYQPPGDFLVNSMNLDLGLRTDGVRVNNVMLPPWAKDAAEFTKLCRDALESPHVSMNLHHWIDLIFGFKQQGQPAEEADNMFHYLTYEGAFNMECVQDTEELAAIELQIREFGQTPRRLFVLPHPPKLTSRKSSSAEPADEEVRTVGATTEGLSRMDSLPGVDSLTRLDSTSSLGQASISSPLKGEQQEWVHVDLLEEGCASNSSLEARNNEMDFSIILCHSLKVHKETVSSVRLAHNGKMLFSVSHDKTLKVHMLEDYKLLRSATISNLPLSCLSVLPDSKTVLVGSWDNTIYAYSVEFASVVNSTYCHDSSVTSLCWRDNILSTGSWDSTVKIWNLDFPSVEGKMSDPLLMCELDHDNEVCCVSLNQLATQVVSGTVDGYVTVWNINEEERDFEYQAHTEVVKAVTFSPDGTKICTCGADKVVRLLDLISKNEIVSRQSPDVFSCMDWSEDVIIFGSENGSLYVWEASTFISIQTCPGHTGGITSLDVSSDGQTLVTGSKDKSIAVWKIKKNGCS